MSWLDEVGGLLQKYSGASPSSPPPGATEDFTKVADSAPTSAVSGGLSEAFRSGDTPPFGEMVSQLFAQSDPAQRAAILQRLIAAAGPALASGGALRELTALLPGTSATAVTPQQAEQVPSEAVRRLADVAEKHDPSIVDRASDFYAQHPTLIKTLGVGALALIMSHLSQRH